MENTQLTSQLIEKVAAVQAKLKAPKGQTNKFGGYKYRSAEDILEAVKPLTTGEGLMLTVTDDIVEVGGRTFVKSTASVHLGHVAVNTSAFAELEVSKKGMDLAQLTGSASSYARKYALNGLFCIDDTKDSDATNDHSKPASKPAAKPAAKKTSAKTKAATFDKFVAHVTEHGMKGLEQVQQDKRWDTFSQEQRTQLESAAKLHKAVN